MDPRKLKRKEALRKRRVFFSAWYLLLWAFGEYMLLTYVDNTETVIFVSILGGMGVAIFYAFMMEEGLR